MMPLLGGRVAFGGFELDLHTGELWKSGRLRRLPPQPAAVLCLLVSRAGELVGRDEIRRRLWGESTFVDFDVGVDYCVSRIRSVLADSVRTPRYIETFPRRGYRFVSPVTRLRPFAEPMLAVLPFSDLNGDPARTYFAEGVTDALITELARIPSIRVISRQSVLHVKGSCRKLDEIVRDLGVDAVVEGTVLHEGNHVRLTAQLIRMEPERHVWAQTYDCDMSAVLATQRDAARAIAACVASALRPPSTASQPPLATRTVPADIVESYLAARAELWKMTAEGLARALQYFREMTVKAPGFAPGLADHAACLMALGFWGHAPVQEAYPAAKQMALAALAIDDTVDQAHLALAMTNWLLDWDPAAADAEFRRAIERSPSNPDAHVLYAIFLAGVGRSEASAVIADALKLDPASLLPNHAAAWIHLLAGEDDQAEAQARRTIELVPDALHGYFVLGWTAWRGHREAEAVAAFETALELSREATSLAFLGHVYGRLGRRDEAKALLHELEQLVARGQAPPSAFAVIHAGLGDTDAAVEWLEKAYQLRDDKVFLLAAYPPFEPLRSHPRFAALVSRMRLRFQAESADRVSPVGDAGFQHPGLQTKKQKAS